MSSKKKHYLHFKALNGYNLPSLYSYYRFDTTSNDRVGTNNFTENNVTHPTGFLNNCVKFSGLNTSFLDISGTNFTFGNGVIDSPFTIFGFIYFDVVGNAFIINKRDGANISEFQLVYVSGKLTMYLFSSGLVTRYILRNFAFTPTPNTWYHFVVAYSGNSLATGIDVYINGVNNNGTTQTVGTYTAMGNTGINMQLGKALITSLPFNGRLDSLGFCNSKLNDTDVQSLYNYQLTNDLA